MGHATATAKYYIYWKRRIWL